MSEVLGNMIVCEKCKDTGFTGVTALRKEVTKELEERINAEIVKRELTDPAEVFTSPLLIEVFSKYIDEFPDCGIEKCQCILGGPH